MAFSLARKQFWEITATRFHYWNGRRHEFRFAFEHTLDSLIKRYGAMTGEFERQCETFYDRYRGYEYDAFDRKKSRRREYLRVEIDASLKSAVSKIISAGTSQAKAYRYRQLRDQFVQQTYRKVLHELGVTKSLIGHATASDRDFALEVSVLKRIELEELDRVALDIVKNQSHLSVLDDVEHYLNGHDTFDADFRRIRKKVADIAREVLRRNPDERDIPALIKIAESGYKLSEDYKGSRETRDVYKALHSSFTRLLGR